MEKGIGIGVLSQKSKAKHSFRISTLIEQSSEAAHSVINIKSLQ